MHCRTLPKQRPCGEKNCERPECVIARVRMSQTEALVGDGELLRAHQALTRLYRLIGNQPGYAVFSVKQILIALSGDEH